MEVFPPLRTQLFQAIQNVKVQNSWRVRQSDYNLSLDRQAVLVNLSVETLAESNRVPMLAGCAGTTLLPFCKPEMKVIKEMKSCPADQMIPCRLIFRTEEDGGRKDALKALCHAPVVPAILGKPEEVQNLGCTMEADCPALLPKSKRCHPDGNQAVLPERQGKVGMSDDLKEELAVPALVGKLVFWKRP